MFNNDFITEMKNSVIPAVERMIEKEKAHISFLAQQDQRLPHIIEFQNNAERSLDMLNKRLLEYTNYVSVHDNSYKFDIDRKDFYSFLNPELKQRTRLRLIELAELGAEEVGVAQFGIKDKVSGLYIEKVWDADDQRWKEYMDWFKSFL